MTFKPLFVAAVFLLPLGCSIPTEKKIDTSMPPVITKTFVAPSVIEVNKISTVFNPSDPVDTTITVRATLADENGLSDIQAVSFTLFGTDGNPLFLDGRLYDNGISPDTSAGDGVFSGTVRLQTLKKNIGNYSIQFQATDRSKLKSSVVISLIVLKNTSNVPPRIFNLTLADTAFIPAGKDSIIVKTSVAVQDSDGLSNVASVSLALKLSDGTLVANYALYDDGAVTPHPPFNITSGDSLANDGIFTSRIIFTKKDVAKYLVELVAVDKAEAKSNSLTKPFYVRNAQNHKPSISHLVMQDTAYIPTGLDTTFVKVTVDVTDPEGLVDIAAVALTSLRPDGSNAGTFNLFDDGSTKIQPPFNIVSGDAVAGDGTYTLSIPLPSGSSRNTYRDFIFQATDRSGETSSTITKRIYIQ